MFVQVKLLKGYTKALTYKIPQSWETKNLEGSIITVPLKNKVVPAIILKFLKEQPIDGDFEIKEAIGKDVIPNDKNYSNFIKKISNFYFAPEKIFYQRIRSFIDKKTTKKKEIKENEPNKKTEKIILTDEQKKVVDYLIPLTKKPKFAPTLIHGVTGSGKTEIYKKVIESCIENNKTVILLLPEVSLSLQFENLLKKQLCSKIPIFGFHSAAKTKEKKELWQTLLDKKPCLIIGVHLPVMLPIPNLGFIIVDEEHESGFQEKKHPKINSKQVALWRAKLYQVPIVLGSATPSINSLYNAKKNNFAFFKLTKRFSGTFPKIKVVQIDGKKRRRSFWITKELELSIADRLQKKEQVLIYINRRGYSFFVQCKKCGFTFVCPNCSVSLTLHKKNDEQKLCCHYCDYKQKNPNCCSECKSGEKDLLKRGVGTQQVVNILTELFPNAKIARADLDTTKKKRSWSQTVENFEKGEIDILVGTQTITKGYHFPKVTLVGILWADLNVHFPIFNASETALQQLIQVAGRAGRCCKTGATSLVIAQIIHDHPIFNFLKEEDYMNFCREEMKFRKETKYPPFGRFVQIEIKNLDEKQVDLDSELISKHLLSLAEKIAPRATILGPAKPLVHKIQKTQIRHIFIKSESFDQIYVILHKLEKIVREQNLESQIFVVPT